MPNSRHSPSPVRNKGDDRSASRSSHEGEGARKKVRRKRQKRRKDEAHSEAAGSGENDTEEKTRRELSGAKGKKKRKRRKVEGASGSDENPDGENDGHGERRKRKKKKRRRKAAGAGEDENDGEGTHGSNDGKSDNLGEAGDKGRKKRRRRKRVGKRVKKKAEDESSQDGSKGSGDEAPSSKDGSDDAEGTGRRRRHRRRHRHRRRSGRSASRSRSCSDGPVVDRRPMIERVKGGVKLFIGRLPLEATQQMLKDAVAEYGEVLEVFLIDSSRRTSGARCAFVRIDTLEHAERAIAEMHEKRCLISDRHELGPIQVAFAKGEAQRLGLDVHKETLPSRWQVPGGDVPKGSAPLLSDPVDPDSLSKEALISIVKEGQRTGGPAFKSHWWGYCDSGKGSVHDYDPKRHPTTSLRQFFVITQQSEWGGKAWFRRAVQWAMLGGRRRRGGGSGSKSSSSSDSNYSSSSSDSATRRMAIEKRRAMLAMKGMTTAPAVAKAALDTPAGQSTGSTPLRPPGLGELIRGAAPPAPQEPPPPEPPSAQRQLASAAERDDLLDEFLAKHRISPSTSFLMLKLTRQQAATIMDGIGDGGSGGVEKAVIARLKRLGIQSGGAGGGSWTSTERNVSPLPSRPLPARETPHGVNGSQVKSTGGRDDSPSPVLGNSLDDSKLLGLPSLDGILDLPKLSEDADDASGKRSDSPGIPEPSAPAEAEAPVAVDTPKRTTPEETPAAGTAETPGAKVFVKNLDKGTSERELRELFSRHGSVQRVDIPRDGDTGTTQGFAYVSLASLAEASKAAKALNFTKPWGRALIVERCRVDGEEDEEDGKPATDSAHPHAGSDNAGAKAESSPAKKRTKSKGKKRRKHNSSASRSRDESNRSGSSGGSSRWSRYTVGSQAQKRSRQHRTRRRGRRRRASSSRDASSRSGDDDSRVSRRKDAAAPASHPNMPWPHGPPPFMMGMPPPGMMPPWGMPPGAMPPWGPPVPQVQLRELEREAAERALRKAEKAARKGRKSERAKGKLQDRSPSRVPQRVSSSSKSGSRSGSSKSSKGRRKAERSARSSGDMSSMMYGAGRHTPFGVMPMPMGWPMPDVHAGKPSPQAASRKASAESDDSDVDMGKVEEEINFADI